MAYTKDQRKTYYEQNKEKYAAHRRATAKRLRQRSREFIIAYKEAHPCTDCGHSFRYYVMDFDHIAGKDGRHRALSRMVSQGYPESYLLAEIAKCELVCANCHRERTYKRSEKAPVI